ncbi:hypothetical protein [Secundilactobacillus yichangensis]|uniref:hypothetical protein n=1 Tax=Secundilactobacillus yichangensis TaxID=2799580 RepID=UPI00194095E4|nr:hypothetical protein [Secundilactobacillus yichangensis]
MMEKFVQLIPLSVIVSMLVIIGLVIYMFHMESEHDFYDYIDKRLDFEKEGINRQIEWQEKAINELLVKSGDAELVTKLKIPEVILNNGINDLVRVWEKRGYLVSIKDNEFILYKLPDELKK